MTFALMALLACATTTTARNLAELVPKDALAVTVVNGLANLDAKIQQLGRGMQIPLPSPFATVRTMAGIQDTVDKGAAAGLALVPSANGHPAPAEVFYLPVTDYDKFIGQLQAKDASQKIAEVRMMNKPLLAARVGGYAVMSRPANRAILDKILAEEDTAAGEIGEFQSYLKAQDVAGVFTSSGVDTFARLGLQGLEEAKSAISQRGGDEMKAGLAAIDLYAEMLRGIGSEVDALAWGVKLDEKGVLHVTSRTRFNSAGAIAPLLRDAKPYEGDLLAGLPAVPFVGVFGGVVPPESYGPLMDMSANFMKAAPELYRLEPDQVDKMIDMSKETLVGFNGMAFLVGVGQPGDPLYSQMLGAMFVDDAAAYLARYKKYWKELDEALGDAEGSFLANMDLEEIEVDGIPAQKLTMGDWSAFTGTLPDAEEFDALMEKMFGPGGKMTMYLAAGDKQTVLMNYTDTQLLKTAMRCIKTGENQLSDAAEVRKTMALLPSGAQAVGLMSPNGLIAFINRMAALMPKQGGPPRLPEFPEAPPVGWAAKASPKGLETDLAVPAQALSAIGQYVMTIRKWQAELKAERN
jgi:hypothetical protein